MEEDDGQEGEGDQEAEAEAEAEGDTQRDAAEDLQHEPDGHEVGESEEQSNRGGEDEDTRRALVAREWEAIDQVRQDTYLEDDQAYLPFVWKRHGTTVHPSSR